MGATDEQMVTVAGFAGGMGLSGKACGALAAAVWMLGTRVVKQGRGGSWPKFVAIGIVVLTVPAAIWSNKQYREHRERRSNWRSEGPVRPPPPPTEQPGEIDKSSERGVPQGETAAEPPTAGDTR